MRTRRRSRTECTVLSTLIFCLRPLLRRPSHEQRRAVLDVVKLSLALDPSGFGLDPLLATCDYSRNPCCASKRRERPPSARNSTKLSAPRRQFKKARPPGRSIPLRSLNRHRDVRPSRRETPRGAYARADRPSLRPARRTRRGRHPGVRRTDSAAGRRPVGPGLTRSAAAVPTTVLSGRNCLRRKSLGSNRRNRTGLQLLAAD